MITLNSSPSFSPLTSDYSTTEKPKGSPNRLNELVAQIDSPSKSVNLRNTSTRELEGLFSAGLITLDDIPLIPEGASINLYGDTKTQLESYKDHRFDVISHFENRLAFEQSIGAPTEQTLKSLNRLLNLDRNGIPGINLKA